VQMLQPKLELMYKILHFFLSIRTHFEYYTKKEWDTSCKMTE
jgi:hypothetical protein